MKKIKEPRYYYVASRTKAGAKQKAQDEIIITEGDFEMVIAWVPQVNAPRIEVFGDSWLGLRNWNDLVWELGNLAREHKNITLAMCESVLIDRGFQERNPDLASATS